MQKIFFFFTLSIILVSCYSVETSSVYNNDFTWAKTQSKPIYLSFKDTRTTPFYFLLSNNTKQKDYRITVRWNNAKQNDVLFNGYDTTLKFLVDHSNIITLKPISRPKIVAYNINSHTREEEGIFALSKEQLEEICNAKSVTVELTGRNNTVSAAFNYRNTFRAFKEFYRNSF
jgi:hypothetical protein